jgi:bacillithiol biosynthesis cysteine-adding enzyme BshC
MAAADCTTLPYAATGAFSGLLTDYIAASPALAPFYHRRPEIAAFQAQIEEKQAAYSPEARQRLVADLRAQYADLGGEVPPAVAANLDLLAKNTTFTITTGHQLNLFTGPLYFVYKIVTAIKLSQQLKAEYPQHDFVPVYWLATEDHDFAEINHFQLFGKTLSWAGPGEGSLGGPVGRLPLDGLADEILNQLPPEVPAAFKEAYANSATLSEATRKLATSLFADYGLVCLDADRPALKQALKPLLKQEIQSQLSNQAVQATNAELTAAGYKPQVYSRPLNLFFLTDEGKRERLEPGAQPEAELLALVDAEPERFSPNVVLRPVYQEVLMPNLAYIGGGAEVAYWFQLKGVFEQLGVPYPIVLPRNSAMYLSRANLGKLRKLGLGTLDIFKPLGELKKQVGAQLGQEEVTLAAQQEALAAAYQQVQDLAQRLDPTLVKAVAAEAQKAAGSLAGLEKRLAKASEAKHETAYSQLTALKDKLFPEGGLQERTDNVLSVLLNNPGFIDQLMQCFEPLALVFAVVEEA